MPVTFIARTWSDLSLRQRRIEVTGAIEVLDLVPACADASQIARSYRRLAMAAGDVEDVGRLAKPGNQAAHELAQTFRLVIDAAQQHGLAQHGNARIDQSCAGGTRFWPQLTRMVDVQHHVGCLAGSPE